MLFKKLFIILRAVTSTMLEYEGDLPGELKKIIDQDWVHETFGAPKETHGPVKPPQPKGWTVGWDIYDYESSLFPGILLVFKYSADMKVVTLVFKKNI